MSREEKFDAWRWDRENARAGRIKLTVQRNNHEVTLDHRGVSIDGERIISDDPTKGGDHGFRVQPDGTVMYRQQAVASVATPDVTVHGAVEAARLAVEEESRRRSGEERDRQRRHSEQQQLITPRGHRAVSQSELEITL